ncbi:MAG: hypothetical protein ABI036_18360, partial [Fibrobacteria bacterium]
MGRFSNHSAASALRAFFKAAIAAKPTKATGPAGFARPVRLSSLAAVAAMALLLPPREGRAAAQTGNLGLGIVAGDPSGISGKLWTGPNNAIDFIVGFSLYNDYVSVN